MKKMIGFIAAAGLTLVMVAGSLLHSDQIAGDDDYSNMYTYTAAETQML